MPRTKATSSTATAVPTTTTTTTTTTTATDANKTTNTTDTKDKRAKNWDLDDDAVFVQQVAKHGRGHWDDVKNGCLDQHKCTNVDLTVEQFSKHYNDLQKKDSKYKKDYKPKKYIRPKGINDEESKLKEFEHTKGQKEREKIHDQIRATLKDLKEKESLSRTDKEKSVDDIKKNMQEKAEERKKIKDERYEALKTQAEEEQTLRKRMLGATEGLTAWLEASKEADKEMLALFREMLQYKKAKTM